MNILRAAMLMMFISIAFVSASQKNKRYNAIYSGIPWFDDKGDVVSAHGACIIKDKDRFYLFGEKHSDTSNAFAGIKCYSSTDLYNWNFERIALAVQTTGKLGPNRVGERPKVMKCAGTGEYVMYMHVDTLSYTDQFVGYATSKSIVGPYEFKGPLLFEGNPIKKWDMGAFQDQDGSGYVLLHGGDIYKLSDDYKSITEHVNKSMATGFESPTIFRKDSIYYFLGSNLTSWERNDNSYYTSTSLKGPWTYRGLFCPEGTLTWNSQTTFVLPVQGSKEITYMFMGDRWAYPKQESAATYVWQPLTISGTSISIPRYLDAWRINTSTGVNSLVTIKGKPVPDFDRSSITFSKEWKQDTLAVKSSDQKDASFSLKFKGTQIGLYALARPDGGYARIALRDGKGKAILSAIVDLYCKYPVSTLKFLSPGLKRGNYTMTVTVLGEHGNWSDKKKNIYGSTGNVVSLHKIITDSCITQEDN